MLQVFQDHVLYLKHNLNARAISSLDQQRVRIEGDVKVLIAEMQASIEEARTGSKLWPLFIVLAVLFAI